MREAEVSVTSCHTLLNGERQCSANERMGRDQYVPRALYIRSVSSIAAVDTLELKGGEAAADAAPSPPPSAGSRDGVVLRSGSELRKG